MIDKCELTYILCRIHDGGIERSLERSALYEIEGDLSAANHARQLAAHYRAEAARYWALFEAAEAEAAKS